ncbi:hypothetical protein Bbelb_296680 [Branchiostoma belcheri]|nr:hypothetical protein Bbelb_296680 [Branchiostoma belcheri]
MTLSRARDRHSLAGLNHDVLLIDSVYSSHIFLLSPAGGSREEVARAFITRANSGPGRDRVLGCKLGSNKGVFMSLHKTSSHRRTSKDNGEKKDGRFGRLVLLLGLRNSGLGDEDWGI